MTEYEENRIILAIRYIETIEPTCFWKHRKIEDWDEWGTQEMEIGG